MAVMDIKKDKKITNKIKKDLERTSLDTNITERKKRFSKLRSAIKKAKKK